MSWKELKGLLKIELFMVEANDILGRTKTDRDVANFLKKETSTRLGKESLTRYAARLEGVLAGIESEETQHNVAQFWIDDVKSYQIRLNNSFGTYKEKVAKYNLGIRILKKYYVSTLDLSHLKE